MFFIIKKKEESKERDKGVEEGRDERR